MDKIMEYLPVLIPILLLEWALVAAALIHVFKHKNYRFGNRTLWVILILVFNQIIGPVLYFAIGRGED